MGRDVALGLDLRERDLETLRRVFARFPFVREVRVFGSRANGSARPTSDLDLAVAAPDAKAREWSDLIEALENAPIVYLLDVVRLEGVANPRLVERIARDGRVIYPEPTPTSME